MAGLGDFIEGFLTADGFRITSKQAGALAAERERDGGTQRRYIWYADPDNGIPVNEARLLAEFAARRGTTDAADATQAFFVTPTLAGLSTAFRQKANEAGVGVRVPIQFFDTPYKADGDKAFGSGGGEEARSVFADFVREAAEQIAARVPQPYVALSSLGEDRGGFGAGADLLVPLVEMLSEPPDGPSLTIVIGSAGAGKSVLFAALFEALARHFAEEKRGQRLASRPILFLPGHIRAETKRSLDGLLAAVAETDAAAPTGPALMRWLNANGLTIWMFDGLDEFFAGEADFVRALEECLAPESRSRVVVCTRDSLLTSSTALRGLVDRHMAGGRVRLFEVSRWERPSQRALAWLRLEGRLPGSGERDPPGVAAFLDTLEGTPALAELATLPYYCDLLLAERQIESDVPADEFELLDVVIDGLINREAEKLASGEMGFDWDVFAGADAFVDVTDLVGEMGAETFASAERRGELLLALHAIGRERLVELIEGLAHHMRMHEPYPNEGQGIDVEDLKSIASFYLDVGLLPDLEPKVLLAMVQFAFFGPAARKGEVRFTHEIIADYLAARHALGLIQAHAESADTLGQALGVRRDLDRTVFLRYLLREIGRQPDLAAIIAAHVEAGRVREAHRDNAQLLVKLLREPRL